MDHTPLTLTTPPGNSDGPTWWVFSSHDVSTIEVTPIAWTQNLYPAFCRENIWHFQAFEVQVTHVPEVDLDGW